MITHVSRTDTAASTRFFQAVRRWLAATLGVLASASVAMACAREAERLMQLSEAELAANGLKREDVVRHAFARYLAQ
jgi:hypothetical protein